MVCVETFSSKVDAQYTYVILDKHNAVIELSQNKIIDYDMFKTASVYDIANLLQLSAKEKFQLITVKTFDDKEKFLQEFYEQLKNTLSNIEDGAEILGIMRFRTFVTKMS